MIERHSVEFDRAIFNVIADLVIVSIAKTRGERRS